MQNIITTVISAIRAIIPTINGWYSALLVALGIIGGFISTYLGGWDTALQTLVLFMALDYITGLMVAGIFHKSKKTPGGGLESRAGFKGLCRKGVVLLIVLVACQLDRMAGTDFIRDACVIAFVTNEALSIIENAGLMGVPVPEVITKGIEILKSKEPKE